MVLKVYAIAGAAVAHCSARLCARAMGGCRASGCRAGIAFGSVVAFDSFCCVLLLSVVRLTRVSVTAAAVDA
eukprot:204599-Rhodomonas_salina.1